MKEDNAGTIIKLKSHIKVLQQRISELEKADALHEQSMRALNRRRELGQLITSISKQFINLPFEEVDQGLEKALERIGLFFGLDRGYICLFTCEGDSLEIAHCWNNKGISCFEEKSQKLQPDRLPWLMRQLHSNEIVKVHNVEVLGPNASAEKDFWLSHSIRSLVYIPLVLRNELAGFVGFDCVREERRFDEETGVMLSIVSEILANAIDSKRIETARRESEANYSSIFNAVEDLILVHDLETTCIIDANDNAIDRLGLDRQTLGETRLKEVIADRSESSDEKIKDNLTKVRAGETVRSEIVLKDKNNRQFWGEVSLKKAFIQGAERAVAVIRDISERKRVNLALYMSEQRFRAIADHTYDWEIWGSPGGRCMWTNPAVERVTGYTVQECMAMKEFPKPFVVDEDKDRVYNTFASAMEGHSGDNLEFRIERKDGRIIWGAASWTPIYDKKGVQQGYRASIRDITKQKTAEEELKKSEARFRAVFDQAYQFMGLLTPEGTMLDVNSSALEVTSKNRDDVIGETFWKTPWWSHSQEERSRVRDSIVRAGQGESVRFETTNWKADGNLAYIDFSIKPIRNEAGEVVMLIPEGRDITERKKIERALKESQRRLSTLISNLPGMVYRCRNDHDWTMEFVSDGCKALTGYTASELTLNASMEYGKLIHEEDRDFVWEEAQKGINSRKAFRLKYRIVRKDGEVRWVWEQGRGVFNEYNELVGVEGVISDVTEQHEVEIEREELLRSLSEKNDELESVIYVSSHDLRAPLVNIEGFSGELSNSIDQFREIIDSGGVPEDTRARLLEMLDEDISESVGFIKSSTRKIDNLLRGLTRLCRVGRLDMHPRKLDMNKLMKNVLASESEQLDAVHSQVEVDDLPPCRGDADQIAEAFADIIDNAAKYVSPERESKIRVTGWRDNGTVTYCVEDNGVGIHYSQKETIFEIFHRIDPEGNVKGQGLGLTIVKRIVNRHGGKVWIESLEGMGSKVFVKLPNV
ncbi:Phytochrome-like protein cph1 [Anaerohalosphaera lusitana]|uniref:histidine kinase n=1 Tax=Anaerohalosphaera lusitana TaxID=1936003 RepID=A0A1U9NN57_9BACT|nr:PAS domain S-box protein [Anaerohalosphaera lusitana]AQT69237.1 Phytochrome-like protein cph1 [Anaerohalosphaera lusitana]